MERKLSTVSSDILQDIRISRQVFKKRKKRKAGAVRGIDGIRSMCRGGNKSEPDHEPDSCCCCCRRARWGIISPGTVPLRQLQHDSMVDPVAIAHHTAQLKKFGFTIMCVRAGLPRASLVLHTGPTCAIDMPATWSARRACRHSPPSTPACCVLPIPLELLDAVL